MSDSNYTPHIGPLVPHPDGVPHIDRSFQEEPLHYITESHRNRLLAIEKEAAALREEVGRLREALTLAVSQIRCEDDCEGLKRDFIGNRYEYRKCSCGADAAFKKAKAALAAKEEA